MSPSNPLLTVDDVCSILGISKDTWRKWRGRRVGPPMLRLPNGSLRITGAALDAWLAEQDAA